MLLLFALLTLASCSTTDDELLILFNDQLYMYPHYLGLVDKPSHKDCQGDIITLYASNSTDIGVRLNYTFVNTMSLCRYGDYNDQIMCYGKREECIVGHTSTGTSSYLKFVRRLGDRCVFGAARLLERS